MSALDRAAAFVARRAGGGVIATAGPAGSPRVKLTLDDVDRLATALAEVRTLHQRLGDTPTDQVDTAQLWEQLDAILAEVVA